MQTDSEPGQVTECRYCGEPIRPTGPGDGIAEEDREYYAWMRVGGGGPLCEGPSVHEPKGPEPGAVAEYGTRMPGGGYQTWDTSPRSEEIYPLAKRIESARRDHGGAYRRRIIVVEDWTEVNAP